MQVVTCEHIPLWSELGLHCIVKGQDYVWVVHSEKLSTNLSLYAMAGEMVRMLEKLRSTCGLSMISDDGYKEMVWDTGVYGNN
jgi:hypothetical protein